VLVGVHLLQRVAEREERTLGRTHDVQELIIIILLVVEQGGMGMQVGRTTGVAQVERCPGAAHVRRIQLVRIGPSVRHQRLPVTTVVREAGPQIRTSNSQMERDNPNRYYRDNDNEHLAHNKTEVTTLIPSLSLMSIMHLLYSVMIYFILSPNASFNPCHITQFRYPFACKPFVQIFPWIFQWNFRWDQGIKL